RRRRLRGVALVDGVGVDRGWVQHLSRARLMTRQRCRRGVESREDGNEPSLLQIAFNVIARRLDPPQTKPSGGDEASVNRHRKMHIARDAVEVHSYRVRIRLEARPWRGHSLLAFSRPGGGFSRQPGLRPWRWLRRLRWPMR